MPREYPEPSLFGVLPAYGIYARHVVGLTMENVSLSYKVQDERPAVVLDDVAVGLFPVRRADAERLLACVRRLYGAPGPR
jgi:hypothetical protein